MEDYRCALCGKELGMMGARGRSFGETVQTLCAACDKLFEDADESKRLKLMERMEALVQQLQGRPFLRPVFFGILYREGDRLKLSPIEAFTHWEETP